LSELTPRAIAQELVRTVPPTVTVTGAYRRQPLLDFSLGLFYTFVPL